MNKTCLVLVSLLCASAAWAVEPDSLKVDFGYNPDASPVCPGWNLFAWQSVATAGPKRNAYPCSNARLAVGDIGVTVSAGGHEGDTVWIHSRDRNAVTDTAAFELLAMYRDWITGATRDASLWIAIDGLHPRTIYRFKAYACDNSNDNKVTFRQFVNGANSKISASIAYVKGTEFSAETPDDVYAAEIEVISDASGGVVIRVTGDLNAALISGFELMRGRDWEPFELLVDFGRNDVSSLQEGAKAAYAPENAEPRSWTYSDLSPNGSSGEVTIGLSMVDESNTERRFIIRDRAGNDFTEPEGFLYYNLYRDSMISSKSKAMWIDVSGLTATGKYRISVSPYDHSYVKTNTLTDWTSGVAGRSKTLVTPKGATFTAATPRDAYAIPMTVRADAEGRVRLNLSTLSEAGIAWLAITSVKPTGLVLLVR